MRRALGVVKGGAVRIGQKKLLLLVSLALVAGAFALSACASGMSGSWVPSRGGVVWTDKPGEVGYDLGVKAARSPADWSSRKRATATR
jgi:hypothetical protein